MSEWKLPPRVQATAMPTEQEIRIMEVHMFGRELEDHERPTAQSPPTVAAGAEVAEVLRELVELYEKSLEPNSWAVCEYNYGARNTSWESAWEDAFAAAQAATGARAAGGRRPQCVTCGHYPDRDPEPGVCEACECPHHDAALPAPGVAALLAECEKRLSDPHGMGHGGACITCNEIVRLLASEGADGTEEGT
jgi:hypothetical protein